MTASNTTSLAGDTTPPGITTTTKITTKATAASDIIVRTITGARHKMVRVPPRDDMDGATFELAGPKGIGWKSWVSTAEAKETGCGSRPSQGARGSNEKKAASGPPFLLPNSLFLNEGTDFFLDVVHLRLSLDNRLF